MYLAIGMDTRPYLLSHMRNSRDSMRRILYTTCIWIVSFDNVSFYHQ